LNIDVERREDHQAKLTVEVESSTFEAAKQRAARHISQHTKIPGFRPGKAPYPVVLRLVGEEAIIEEAVELLVSEIYPKALDEAGVEPYGPGSLEALKSTNPPIFEFLVPLKAEVELGDYESVQQAYELAGVPEQDVETLLNNLVEQHAIIEPAERPVQEGDLVYIKLSAMNQQPKEGEKETLIEERSLPVNVMAEDGDNTMEWPFPGFSRKLVGLAAGDEASLEYAYPEDTAFSAFKGISAKFMVMVESVKLRVLPDLDDEFAQSVGEFPTLEALRAQIRKNLEEQNEMDYNQEYDEQVLDQVVERSVIKYPPQMLDHEIDHVIEHLGERLERQGMSMDLYLKSRQMEASALREEASPVAESRLKRSLVLLELAETMKIEVTPDDLQEETNRTLEGFARQMSEKDFRKFVSKRENASGLIENIMMDMVIQRTQERLRNMARGLEPTLEESPVVPEEESPQQLSESEVAESSGDEQATENKQAS